MKTLTLAEILEYFGFEWVVQDAPILQSYKLYLVDNDNMVIKCIEVKENPKEEAGYTLLITRDRPIPFGVDGYKTLPEYPEYSIEEL